MVPELVENARYPAPDMSGFREILTTYFLAPAWAVQLTASELDVAVPILRSVGANQR